MQLSKTALASSNPVFGVQGWRALLDLTEESVKTVGKEDARKFRARRGMLALPVTILRTWVVLRL